MRDLILSVRADESCHREVNHHFADCNYWEPIDHSKVSLNEKDGALLDFERKDQPTLEQNEATHDDKKADSPDQNKK